MSGEIVDYVCFELDPYSFSTEGLSLRPLLGVAMPMSEKNTLVCEAARHCFNLYDGFVFELISWENRLSEPVRIVIHGAIHRQEVLK